MANAPAWCLARVGDGAITFCIRSAVRRTRPRLVMPPPRRSSPNGPRRPQHEGPGQARGPATTEALKAPIAPRGPEPLEPESNIQEP